MAHCQEVQNKKQKITVKARDKKNFIVTPDVKTTMRIDRSKGFE